MRMHLLICLISSFLLHSRKNTGQPQHGWSSTVVKTQLSSPRGVVQVLKIFLDVPKMKMWHFRLLSPPDVACSCYTDGVETLLPKEPERTLSKPICSQENPTKPLGLGGLELRGLMVDSDIIVRLVCCLLRKPWAEKTNPSLTQELSFQVGWRHSARITLKNPTKQYYRTTTLKVQMNPKIGVFLLQNLQSLPYNLLKFGWQ